MADVFAPPISDAQLISLVRSYLGDERLVIADWRWARLGTRH